MNENMVKNNESEVVQPNQEGQQGKMFTQEQVNEIVKKRLERQKEDNLDAQNLEERAKELEAKERDFSLRESRFSCREYLNEKGYPDDLLDILDTSDLKKFKEKADKTCQIFGLTYYSVAPLASTEPIIKKETLGFEKDEGHKPKGYWATDPERAAFEMFKGY